MPILAAYPVIGDRHLSSSIIFFPRYNDCDTPVVISMTNLSQAQCVPCSGSEVAATPAEIATLLPQIPGWCQFQVNGIDRIERVYVFKDFVTALAFTNAVGEIAEAAAHHPVLMTEWGRVTVTWWTHTVQGLHQNDLIMAAKTDAIALRFT